MDLPTDIIKHVLRDNVGPSTFASARQVNRSWAHACEDETLLTAVASYVDGLTRTQFCGLLRLTPCSARAYRHDVRRVVTTHGVREFYLYHASTVQHALREGGGFEGLRKRRIVMPYQPNTIIQSRRNSHLEERLHKRKVARLAFACMRELPLESTRLDRRLAWERERQRALIV